MDRISHIGIVVAVGDGWVKTIEGNTAGDKKKSKDERNGGEVAQKQRGFKKVNEKKLPVYIVGFAKPAFED